MAWKTIYLYIFLLICLQLTAQVQMFNKVFSSDTLNILAPAVLAVEDGGYLIAHTYNAPNSYEGFGMRKISQIGETEWFKHLNYGQEEHVMIGGGVLCTTLDGLFMLVGSKGAEPLVSGGNRDILMIKFDVEGNIIWTKSNGDTDKIENAYHITPTQDGGYIMCGIQRSFTSSNRFYVLKTDAFGNKEWDRVYNPTQHGSAFSIFETNAGYIVSGFMKFPITDTDMFIIEIDKQGNMLWSKNYGGSEIDLACLVLPSQNDNSYFILSGIRENNIRKPFVAKLDSLGNIIWNKLYNMEIGGMQEAPLLQTLDGGFIGLFGYKIYSNYDIPCIWRFTSTGDTLWTRTIPGLNPNDDWYLKDIAATADGGYILSGFNYSEQSSWVVKTDSLGYTCSYIGCDSTAVIDNVTTPFRYEQQMHIAPNPAQNQVTLYLPAAAAAATGRQLLLYNASGQLVRQAALPNYVSQYTFSVAGLPAGIYFCRVGANMQKLVVTW
ncbi:hypothetical protein C7N43_22045 [Sphingobacteriales bacterium UPWRP_1]|nr:hypothetical protein C7N43_22045 [Sphingobacteriales bacterium UPWRP_1]